MATTTEIVTQLYTNIYGRAPTTLELNQQVGRVDLGGVSTSQIAAELIDSTAGQNAQAITRIYLAAFGRYPDLGGLQVQENAVTNAGTSLKSLAVNFTATAEFATKFPSGTDATAYITALYSNVLGRAPDAAGLAVQIAAYNAYPGDTTAKQSEFLFRFAQSAELVTTRGGEIKAVVAYAAVDNQIPTTSQAQQASAIPLSTLISGLNDGLNGNGFGGGGGVSGTTYTLTTAIDALNGTTANDTFIAQLGATNTLQAADNINGGTGIDVLRLVTDGGTATNSVGVTANGIEILEVQSQSTGGTTVDVTNFTGLTQIRSASSTQALAITGAKTALGYAVTAGQTVGAVTITGGTAGAADTGSLALSGNTVTAFTYNGIETFSVNNLTTASTITTLASDAAKTLQISGDAKLTITNAVAGVTSIDASTSTGGVVLTADGTKDVAFVGGSGADQITYAAGTLNAADKVDGGAGIDTLVTTFADISAGTYAAAAKVSNVENISFTDNLGGTYDTSKVAGDTTVTLQAGFTGGAVVSGAASGFTVVNQAASAGTLTVTVVDATLAANTADVVNLTVGKAATAGFSSGTVTAAGVETVNISSVGGTPTGGTASNNSLTLGASDATKIVITGAGGLALTAGAGTAIATIDASASTGGVDLSAVTGYKAAGATITGGSGADVLGGSAGADIISGGAGADVILGSNGIDTITLGDGADSVRYSAVSQSTAGSADIIQDFVSGTDSIDLTAIAAGRSITFGGVGASFGQTQALIKEASGTLQVVYQADTNTIWVDANDDGALNNNDLQITLKGVSTITAADVKAGATTAIVLSAPAAVLNTTTSTGVTGSAKTTTGNDFIQTTAANLAGSKIDAAAGVDTVTITDVVAVAAQDVTNTTFTGVEFLNLGVNGITAAAPTLLAGMTVSGDNTKDNAIVFAAGAVDLTSITFSGVDKVTTTGATTVNQTVLTALQQANGGTDSTLDVTGSLLVTGSTSADFSTGTTNGVGVLTVKASTGVEFQTAGSTHTLKVFGTEDITSYTNATGVVLGAVNLNLAAEQNKVITVNLTVGGAAYTAAATITTGGAVGQVDTVTTGSGADTITLFSGTELDVITTGSGNDTVNLNAAGASAAVVTGGVGSDTANVILTAASSFATGKLIGFETINVSGAFDLTSLALGAADGDANVAINVAAAVNATTFVGTGFTKQITYTDLGVLNAKAVDVTGAGLDDTFAFTLTDANGWVAATNKLDGAAGNDTATFNLGANALAFDISGASNVKAIETIIFTGSGALTAVKWDATNQATLKLVDASAVTSGVTFGTLKQNFTIDTTIKTGAFNDTITALDGVAGSTKRLTIDLGAGVNKITDITTANLELTTFVIGTTPAGTTSLTIGTATKDLATGVGTGNIFDFATDVTSITNSFASVVKGQATIVVTQTATDTTIAFDADGSGGIGLGEAQITITGQLISTGSMSIQGGNIVI